MPFFLLSFLISAPAQAMSWKEFDNLTLRAGYVTSALSISVEDKNGAAQKLEIQPNAPTRFFVSGSYAWAGGSYSFAAKTTDKETFEKGNTSSTDFQFRFNLTKFSIDLFYQQYKGYFLANTDAFQAKAVGAPFIQYNDLNTEHSGLGFTWVFDHEDNSMAAAFDQSARQTKSGWTFLASTSLDNHRFSTSTSLVPSIASGKYGDFENVRAATLYSLNVGGGVAGTWIPHSYYFLSGSLMLKVGEELQKIERTDKTSQNTRNNAQTDLRLSAGYNGDRFLAGVAVLTNLVTYNIENAKMNFQTSNVMVFVGTRVL